MKLLAMLCCLCSSMWCADFDCTFVGSSPFSLLEAVYQARMGKKVIVIESADDCGGAWRTIDVCGVSGVDLGCHEIGCHLELEDFLKDCLNCQLVALDSPLSTFKDPQTHPSGFYFSGGCREFMQKLKQLVTSNSIDLRLNTRVLEVAVQGNETIVNTTQGSFSTDSVFVTLRSSFSIRENDQIFSKQDIKKQKFHHFYLLVADPSEPRFTYYDDFESKIYRAMNLSHFVGLSDTGRHLLIVQPKSLNTTGTQLLEILKKKNLVSETADLIQEEYCPYEREESIQDTLCNLSPSARQLFHFIETTRLEHMELSIAKWRQVFP